MSSKRRRTSEKSSNVPPGSTLVTTAPDERPVPSGGVRWWMVLAGIAVALAVCFEVYGPSLKGEFLFDDEYLPFLLPDLQHAPLRSWLGVRPVLMVSYWLNYTNSGLDPYAYHVVSVVLHSLNAVLAWLIVRRLMARTGDTGPRLEVVSGFAGALFLLHPLQTESVAYVASRSESMSVFFFLAAFAVFIYRGDEVIGWVRTVAVLALFALACSVKEHTTVLPALLLLTDYYFTTPFRFDGIRRNFKLYALVLAGGALGVAAVVRVLSTAQTAGFRMQEFAWHQYLFTQFRVIPTYIGLFLLPSGLNGDYDFPLSRTPMEHSATVWLAALAAVSVFAWMYRKEYPLASFGWFGFLILLAPTSSFVPIRDVIAERRTYLPFICLLLIAADVLRRVRVQPALLAAAMVPLLALSGYATYQRSKVWSTALGFWTDTAAKSPNNPRAHFQLAYAQWKAGKCSAAADSYKRVAQLQKPDDRLLIDWALALDCLNKPDEAVEKLRQAAAMANSALIHAQIGMIYGKRDRFQEALLALEQAERIDPRFEMTYVYRGNVHAGRGEYETAIGWYKHAIAINPNNDTAREALAVAERSLAKLR